MSRIISTNQAKRILLEKGAKRVSEKAADTFAWALQDFGASVAEFVVFVAKQANKKTITKQDVENVAAQLKKEKKRFGLN